MGFGRLTAQDVPCDYQTKQTMKTDLRPITFWCIILLCISCAKEHIEPLGSDASSDQRSLLD
ncbi:MAG: hypothetical protein HKN79_04895, partial [Flavobacteriales bacterium]|nr:hypothetical protein [Flavobacteriales bacterium]